MLQPVDAIEELGQMRQARRRRAIGEVGVADHVTHVFEGNLLLLCRGGKDLGGFARAVLDLIVGRLQRRENGLA